MVSTAQFEVIDHTGDIGIRLRAPGLVELFKRAALAMFDIICPAGRDYGSEKRTLSVAAADTEELLVNWLSELNFLFQTEGFLLVEIPYMTIEANELRARIVGEFMDRRRHEIHADIKAVTFHAIEVGKSDRGWYAQVIFDI